MASAELDSALHRLSLSSPGQPQRSHSASSSPGQEHRPTALRAYVPDNLALEQLRRQKQLHSRPSSSGSPSLGASSTRQYPSRDWAPVQTRHDQDSSASSRGRSQLDISPVPPFAAVKSSLPDLFPTFQDFLTRDTSGGERWHETMQGGVGLGMSFEGFDSASFTRERPTRRGPSDPFTSTDPFASFDPTTPTSDSFTFYPSPSFGASRTGTPSTPNRRTSADLFERLEFTPPRKRAYVTPQRPEYALAFEPPNTPVRARRASALSSSSPVFVPSSSTKSGYFSPRSDPFQSDSTTPSASSNEQGFTPPLESPISPLSNSDADLVAALHGGRRPSITQVAPADVSPGNDLGASGGASDPPEIVNTGNQGPMVVQVGDWMCGVCAFVNWRRRKICMRCFPFANDIGKLLTINSQRAATLATPPYPSASTRSIASTATSSPALYGEITTEALRSAAISRAFETFGSPDRDRSMQAYPGSAPQQLYPSPYASPTNTIRMQASSRPGAVLGSTYESPTIHEEPFSAFYLPSTRDTLPPSYFSPASPTARLRGVGSSPYTSDETYRSSEQNSRASLGYYPSF